MLGKSNGFLIKLKLDLFCDTRTGLTNELPFYQLRYNSYLKKMMQFPIPNICTKNFYCHSNFRNTMN